MSMTMTQKILADHAGLKEVKAGQLIEARLDMVLGELSLGRKSFSRFYTSTIN